MGGEHTMGGEHITTVSTGLLCFYVFLCLLDILFHCIGLYLLWSVRNTISVFKTYIVSLSTAEFLASIAFLVKTCLLFIHSPSHAIEDVIAHADIVRYTTFSFCYYMVKLYLILDQLASIFLPVRYKANWTKKKLNGLLNGTWFVGIVLCFVVIFGIDWHQKDYARRIHKILFYADIASVSLFVLSFLILCCKIKPSSVRPEPNGVVPTQHQAPSALRLLFRTNYVVIFLFHIMLLLFHFTADILILYKHQSDNSMTPLYLVSYLGDAFAYIYMSPDLKTMIKERFMRYGCLKNVSDSIELTNPNTIPN